GSGLGHELVVQAGLDSTGLRGDPAAHAGHRCGECLGDRWVALLDHRHDVTSPCRLPVGGRRSATPSVKVLDTPSKPLNTHCTHGNKASEHPVDAGALAVR